ncbi:DUF6069 family protein [Actinocatenispora sera]|uniref:DUF6069 family protein n=1 Tax=Actinocatenispora sera TaxID=390989 RepID=UPI0033DB3DB6
MRRAAIRGSAVIAAVAVPVLVWIVTVPLLGHRLRVEGPPSLEIRVGTVIVLALAAALAGWALLAALERLTRHGRTVWTVAALVTLAGSFVLLTGPMATATRTSLALMHLGLAAVLIPGMTRAPAARERRS